MTTLKIEVPARFKGVRELLERSAQGDKDAAREFCRMMDADETGELVRVAGGDLPELVERGLATLNSSGNLAQREAIRRRLADIRRELAGEAPLPIETLLVERVAVCWLDAYTADILCYGADGCSLPLREFHERKRDRAHRRLMGSLRTLATCRKLLKPEAPVNLSVNQTVTVEAPAAEHPTTLDLLAPRITCPN